MNLFAENGIHMFLWIGLGASPDFIQKVFGVPSAIQVDIEKVALPELDTPLSVAVRTIIDDIRTQRHKCMRVSQNGFFLLKTVAQNSIL
jgi:protein transport protein SEC24